MLLASVLFVGALLGLRHNVLVLVPAGFTSASVVFAASIAGGDSIWAMLLVTAFSLVALQLGYLAGAWYSQASAVEEDANSENSNDNAHVVYLNRHWAGKIQ